MFKRYGRIIQTEEINNNEWIKFLRDSAEEIIEWYKEVLKVNRLVLGLENICSHIPSDEVCTNFPDIVINIIDNDNVNAFATKVGNIYYINIFVGVIKFLHPYFEEVSLQNNFNKKYEGKTNLVMLDIAIKYLVLHEFFHIKNGHCDYIQKLKKQNLFEFNTKVQNSSTIFLQTLEYDADCCAVHILGWWLMENVFDSLEYRQFKPMRFNENTLNLIIKDLTIMLFSIYTLLKKMDTGIRKVENITREFLHETSHPIAGIRIDYMTKNLLYMVAKFYYGEEIKIIINGILENYKDFVQKESNLQYAQYTSLISLDKTCKEHMQMIHDNWKLVREQLDVCYGKLPEYRSHTF